MLIVRVEHHPFAGFQPVELGRMLLHADGGAAGMAHFRVEVLRGTGSVQLDRLIPARTGLAMRCRTPLELPWVTVAKALQAVDYVKGMQDG